MRRIEIGDFLLIAEQHCGIAAEQLARIPRVVSLAEAALAAPLMRFSDGDAILSSPGERAAMYCSRIVAYHPLPDGNKRTGYDVMREFLDRNGVPFSHPAEGFSGTAQAIEDLAARRLGEQDFLAWVKARTGG